MSQQSGRIVWKLHDEPHIEGRRITVRFVHGLVEERGLAPREVADRYVSGVPWIPGQQLH